MKIAVIGSGGREHAIIKKLRENPSVTTIYALPGNGGMKEDAECVPVSATDIEGAVAFCKEKGVSYAVVAPDDPLVMGMADAMEEAGIPAFGPSAAAAQIEGSKAFAKNLMKKYHIPTADYEIFTDPAEAYAYVETCRIPVVLKASGLALGKGVLIANTREEAREAVHTIMEERKFGKSGDELVIEEFLTGPEVSVLSFTDGKTLVPMISSMDHKRALDGDQGLNTGGMGTIAPNPYYTKEIADRCMEEIFLPTMEAMNSEGRTFKGCLYFGLMLTEDGPKVIEYNCRFGDPETQVVLPLLKTDLLTIMQAVTEERLSEISIQWKEECAACVILASGGYPESYQKGYPITLPADKSSIYMAGVADKDGTPVTAGGRVLGVTETAPTLREAIEKAYRKVSEISFQDMHYRHDIGARALQASREN